MRLILKELEQQKLEDCRNVPIESNYEYGSPHYQISLENTTESSSQSLSLMFWSLLRRCWQCFFLSIDGDNEDDGWENAEDNKSNLQQCDLDETADMTNSKTLLIVIMPLTRTMCSLVILMRQSYSIAATGIGSSVQSGAEEGGSLIKLELYLQPVPPPSLSSHRFWLHIDIVNRIQLILHKETWISWTLTTNVGLRGWLGPKNVTIFILSAEYWHPAAVIAQENWKPGIFLLFDQWTKRIVVAEIFDPHWDRQLSTTHGL